MKYLDFYEMSLEPFSNAPVSRFYYNSAPHSKALVRLMYAIDTMKGLAVLIGEIGSGKTTLARKLLDSLSEDEYEAALLVMIHTGVDPKWLLKRIAMQLGVEDPHEDRLKLLGQLYQRLVEIHESGKKAVVLIDEAQMLESREVMEEFRGLLNLELPETKLLNILFFGLPSLENCLALDPPLSQRIAVKYRLGSLDEEATEAYIKHRLRLSGAKRMLFTKESTAIIYQMSNGIPRLINTICDNALFEGFMLKTPLVEAPLVQSVCMDLGLRRDVARIHVGGTRASDYITPTEIPGAGTPPPGPNPQPLPSNPNPMPNQTSPSPPSSPSSPVEQTSGQTPLMDEIDGILDNLIDKV